MAYKSRVSDAVVRRLPMYYRHLRELEKAGVVRISSQELGERMHLTPSQIRQDINCFGGFGQQGYGYNVQYLYDEIGKLLGLDVKHKMIIVCAVYGLSFKTAFGCNINLTAYDRIYICRLCCPVKIYNTIHISVIRYGKIFHTKLLCPVHNLTNLAGTVKQ